MPSTPSIPDDTANIRKTMTRNSTPMAVCASFPLPRAATCALRRGARAASCAVIAMRLRDVVGPGQNRAADLAGVDAERFDRRHDNVALRTAGADDEHDIVDEFGKRPH